MKKTICSKCKYEFTNKSGNFNKHFQSCKGTYTPQYIKLISCKYCFLNFETLSNNERANHSRWCCKNPKRSTYSEELIKARACKVSFENQYTKAKKQNKKIPISPCKGKPGSFLGKKHSEKTKALQREKALNSSHRRVMKKTAFYKNVLMDSSWEIELAKRLDFLGIKWVRPMAVPWKDNNGVTHHYFADFYLPEYNLYLDPKNLYVIKLQNNKLICLSKQYDNIAIIPSLKECKKYTPIATVYLNKFLN